MTTNSSAAHALEPLPPVKSQPARTVETIDGMCRIPRLDLMRGGRLHCVRVAWRLVGPKRAPIVVVLGGISANRNVTSDQGKRGWWSGLVGRDRAIDTHRYRILSFDWVGGSAGSSGPAPGSFARQSFPPVSPDDQATALRWILGQLDIKRIRGFVGASYGGMVALAFAARYPQCLERLVVVSAADRPHALATAWRSVQRRIVRLGLTNGAGDEALSISRGLAMTTYRSPEEFDARFAGPATFAEDFYRFPVDDYLEARGADFVSRIVPESYLCLSESIDLQDVDAGKIRTPTTLVAVQQDQLVPLVQMRDLARRLTDRCRLVELDSLFGHDAFLKEEDALTPVFVEALAGESS
ncbi:MAG: homoserine O-succinyltransferase [Chromatiales bacterium]|jgi:homoserine O-acetyltransferase|nr:homoserine O-succinyltransferase [Chromatiales bacterium]MDH4030534.1 homoserine O-succinyltransferase [Chromatiales bacterium]